MPFYKIYDKPVFITYEKSRELHIEWCKYKGLPTVGTPSITIQGSETYNEKQDFHKRFLNNLYNSNRQDFETRWFNFDIGKDQIKQNIWYLLEDYCCLSKTSHLTTDHRNMGIMESLNGLDHDLPLGSSFYINNEIKAQNLVGMIGSIFKKKFNSIKIDVYSIGRIQGNLLDFIITFNNGSVMKFSRGSILFNP